MKSSYNKIVPGISPVLKMNAAQKPFITFQLFYIKRFNFIPLQKRNLEK